MIAAGSNYRASIFVIVSALLCCAGLAHCWKFGAQLPPAVSDPDWCMSLANRTRIYAEETRVFGNHRDREQVQQQILRHTRPLLRNGFGKRTELSCTIDEGGNVHEVHVEASSGFRSHDELAVQTVRQAAPFNAINGIEPELDQYRLDFNFNAHTWRSECYPDTLGPSFDLFMNELVHAWHPAHQDALADCNVKFKLDSSGTIIGAEMISRPSYDPPVDPKTECAFEQSVTQAANSLLQRRVFTQPTTMDQIDVRFLYDPRPSSEEIIGGHLIGTHCGPLTEYASADITFRDPPMTVPTKSPSLTDR